MSTPSTIDAGRLGIMLNELRLPSMKAMWADFAARADKEGKPLDQVRREMLAEKQPMEQFTTPESLGALAVFLCSDAAATMTGVPVSMDGGWTAT